MVLVVLVVVVVVVKFVFKGGNWCAKFSLKCLSLACFPWYFLLGLVCLLVGFFGGFVGYICWCYYITCNGGRRVFVGVLY